jgi:hypothetical protein
MKTVSLFLLIVAVVWAVFNRERIYVRDPVAKVYRNDTKQSGFEVYINASNDVLMQQDLGDRTTSRTILQHWDKIPSTPQSLVCLPWLVCLADADHPAVMPRVSGGKNAVDPQVVMNGRTITYVDPANGRIRVQL